jgi:outer membrane assembly lipoprotein YfiO
MELLGGNWLARSKEIGSPGDSLSAIREKSEAGKHGAVVGAVKKHLKKFPSDATCEEAMLLAGQSELARKRYYKAFEWFDKQVVRYPAGPLFERGLNGEIEAGEALLGGKKRKVWGVFPISARDEGVEILEKVATHAPGTKMAESALLKVAEWYYSEGDWADAVEAYDTFVAVMPRSRHVGQAMLNAAHATYEMYKGSGYDETPLLEAQQRYRAVQEQFPRLAERTGIARTLIEIRSTQAEKVYDCGTFYERTHRPEAAVYYYRRVVLEYPDTYYGQMSRDALVRLLGPDAEADLPARPTRPSETKRAERLGPVGGQR